MTAPGVGEIALLCPVAYAVVRFAAFVLSRAVDGIKRLSGVVLEVKTHRERRRADLYRAQLASQELKRTLTDEPLVGSAAAPARRSRATIQKRSA